MVSKKKRTYQENNFFFLKNMRTKINCFHTSFFYFWFIEKYHEIHNNLFLVRKYIKNIEIISMQPNIFIFIMIIQIFCFIPQSRSFSEVKNIMPPWTPISKFHMNKSVENPFRSYLYLCFLIIKIHIWKFILDIKFSQHKLMS